MLARTAGPWSASGVMVAALVRLRPSLELPFRRLNLLWNPFGEVDAETRARLAVTDVQRWVEPLQRPGVVVQFLGDSGTGKTTSLLALQLHLPGAPLVRLHPGEPWSVPATPRVLVDEMQLMSRARRRDVFLPSRSFAAATHQDFRAELERAGFTVHTVVPAQHLDESRLGEICRRRIAWARRGEGPVPGVSSATLRRLLATHGVNVRAMEQELYSIFQSMEDIGDG